MAGQAATSVDDGLKATSKTALKEEGYEGELPGGSRHAR
jgi:hypothetical protein